jgi:hypothetical protein
MGRLFSANRIVLALFANAFLLLLILLAVTSRDGRWLPGSVAFGQLQSLSQPAAAGPLSVMPAQLAPNTWGCYVMDAQNQTLCVYRFDPGKPLLLLAAARDIQYDHKLPLYNTAPPPDEIKAILDRAEQPVRAAPTTNRSPEAIGP